MTRKRHIVIVDDEANIGRSLRLILEGESYRVSVFDSVQAFAADRSRAAADVYLLDVRLPDGNGIDLLRSVRQWDERAAVVTERLALLRPANPGVTYHLRLDDARPRVHAAPDLVNGILTNLLQNAAEAAGPDGAVLVQTRGEGGEVTIEVHDSGPGLSDEASATLFEPTITFKKHGMGLGLSIAKKNALLSGGDVTPIRGELGGAAFRVSLPS